MKLLNIFLIVIMPFFLIITGCQLEEPSTKITKTDLKGESISRYVAIGNSLTAGVQSGGLVEEFQMYSFPNQIAGQLGITNFAQPTVSWPGIPAVLQINLITESVASVPGGDGLPNNTTYPAPYNNLGIPTAMAWDILNATTSNDGYRWVF